jgi:hypothetical protein
VAKYFIRELRWGAELGEEFWRVDTDEAARIDVDSASGHNVFHREPGEDIAITFEKISRGGTWHELSYKPGTYFPRMARPSGIKEESPGRNPDISDEFRYYRARSTGQLHAFIEGLDQICRVIHPDEANLRCYGHATRNILILACTEVEAHWKTILGANGYKSAKPNSRLDTNDYVHLLDAMRLNEYVVNLNYYPWLPMVTPFTHWRTDCPTTSLPWYDAYNKVKHDREGHFDTATLECALTAVAGCFVMLCAQYGWDFALQDKAGERAFFQLIRAPNWPVGERYVPPFGTTYTARPYQFPKIKSRRLSGGAGKRINTPPRA